jgi:hypothetical protein
VFGSAGCSLLRAEGLSCSFGVVYEGLMISKLQFLIISVADPGCLSRIKDSGSGSRNLDIFNPGSRMLIPDPGSGFFPIPDLEPGSRIQGSKKHWIPDPQHRKKFKFLFSCKIIFSHQTLDQDPQLE